jgi:hypothetical protein
MPGRLNAGLVGGGKMIVLQFIGLILLLRCVTWSIAFITFIFIGALGLSNLPPVRQTELGASRGVLDTLRAQAMRGMLGLFISIIRTVSEKTATVITQVPPQILQIIHGLGIPSHMILEIGRVAICCTTGILIAITMGAIGSAIYASIYTKQGAILCLNQH